MDTIVKYDKHILYFYTTTSYSSTELPFQSGPEHKKKKGKKEKEKKGKKEKKEEESNTDSDDDIQRVAASDQKAGIDAVDEHHSESTVSMNDYFKDKLKKKGGIWHEWLFQCCCFSCV